MRTKKRFHKVNKPKDISGFCFRKDLCFWSPQNEADILKEVMTKNEEIVRQDVQIEKQKEKKMIS